MFKKKAPKGPQVSGASVSAVHRARGKSSGPLPYRIASAVEFDTECPPNLLSVEFRKVKLRLFRPDYLVVVGMCLASLYFIAAGIMQIRSVLAEEKHLQVVGAKAGQLSTARSKMEAEVASLRSKTYEYQRLFLPTTAKFSLADMLYKIGRNMPSDYFISEFSARLAPDYFTGGRRTGGKVLDKVDAFSPQYLINLQLQGVTKKATASQASEFGKIFDPPAIPVEVGGGVSGEGMGFTISTKFAPLVLCTPPVGNVTTKVPVPVIPQTSANKKPGAR